jgi:hypothetical protein
MSDNTFASLFQSRVTVLGQSLVTLAQLREASVAASNHQFAVNPTKVKSIFTSLKKDGQLWVMPTVAYVKPAQGEEPKYRLVSGRHRDAGIEQLLTEYGLNASGKLTKRTETNATDLTDITDTVLCQVVECADEVALNQYLIAQNGSRSMSEPEKKTVLASCVKLTSLQQFKLNFGKLISEGITLPNGGNISLVTAGQIVGMVTKAIGSKTEHMSTEVQQEFVDTFQEFLDENSDSVPSNFALKFREIVEPFFSMAAGTSFDADGDSVDIVFIQHIADSITEPAKVAKGSKSKTEDAAATIAALQAQIAALMAAQQA